MWCLFYVLLLFSDGYGEKAVETGMVAFSAEMSQDVEVSGGCTLVFDNVISNVGDNQDIPFDQVETDTSHSYHGPTGIFTCPRTGVYVFQATLLTLPNIRVQFQIVKEGQLFAAGYSYGAPDRYGTGTTAGIVMLQKGDKVWVKVHDVHHSGSGHMINGLYSSFMGFSVKLD